MCVIDFHFGLLKALIARHPLPGRHTGRLLTLDSLTRTLAHRQFVDFLDYLCLGNLIMFNNTRVVPARLFGQKESGGKLEVLVEHVSDQHRVLAHIRASRAPKPGTRILIEGGDSTEMLQRHDTLFELAFAEPMLPLLGRVGHMPLPPHIDRPDDTADHERYRTVYAQRTGTVAAPTAGLHFDEALLETIHAEGADTAFVTLHVSAGTFQPVRVKRIEGHVTHRGWLGVGQDMVDAVSVCRARGGRVVVVGTTSVRSLENATRDGELKLLSSDTDIFIFPGQPFHVAGALITNFHLPESTLLMLVSAFVDYPEIMAAYAAAMTQDYRFFSYNDAIFITRSPAPRGSED